MAYLLELRYFEYSPNKITRPSKSIRKVPLRKMSKTQNLYTEVKRLASSWYQAIFNVDGLGLLENRSLFLSTFESLDWEELQFALPKWNNAELHILAEIIKTGDDLNNSKRAHLFGHIITLTDYPTSSMLLNEDFIYYIIKNKIQSIELIQSLKLKVEELKTNNYLNEEDFTFWHNKLNEVERNL